MPKGYQHLTRNKRSQIQALKSSGFTQSGIATALNVSPSTISRELKRNKGDTHYDFHYADVQASIRRSQVSRKPKRMTDEVKTRIKKHLLDDWSPEQISGRLKTEGIRISHETIYKYVWDDKRHYGTLFMHLRHFGKKYKKRSSSKGCRSKIPGRIDISQRPEIVTAKARVGDWEGDTIIGPKHKSALLTYVDRKSKLTLIAKLKRKTADNVFKASCRKFKNIKNHIMTITFDNGTEFSAHQKISQVTGAKCYFATPYHAWERGLNEHTNGLIRRYFPKSTDLSLLSDKEIQRVENLLNNRPRKVLGYQTPKEVFAAATRSKPRIALHS